MWLRGLPNVHRWHLIRIAGLNLGTILRARIGRGTPRGLADLSAALSALQNALERRLEAILDLGESLFVADARLRFALAMPSISRRVA